MKIGYFIFSNAQGTGGHHHSLKTISSAVNSDNEDNVHIFNFGVAPSPVLINNKNYHFFKINEFTILIKLIQALFICKKNKIDIMHAFDVNAYFYVRIISLFLKIPSLYTKCGGANNKYNPNTAVGVTFSGENFDYLEKLKKHKKLYLIENRVPVFSQNLKEINKLKEKYNTKGYLIFLRIIRISKYYESSIIKTVKFVANFSNCKLFLIGSVYDEVLSEKIKKIASNLNVTLIMLDDIIYTKNAKEFIDLGDCMFGTGRAAMEAMYLNKNLLSFVDAFDFPVVVNKENFDSFKYYNFSERVKVNGDYTLEKEVEKITNESLFNKNTIFVKEVFSKHYAIDTAIPKYIAIYKDVLETKYKYYNIKDFFINFYFHFFRASIILKRFL